MRLKWAIPAAAVALLATGYAGFWLLAADEARRALAEWAQDRRDEGYEIRHSEPRVSGFPSRLRIELDEPLIGGPAGRWVWRGEALEAAVRPWDLDDVDIELSGPQQFHFLDEGEWLDFVWTAHRARARVEFDRQGRARAFAFDGTQIEIDGAALAGPARLRHLSVDGRLGHAPNPEHGSETAHMTARLEGLILPPGTPRGLGLEVAALAFDTSLMGPLSDKGFTLAKEELAEALADWRDAGGTLEIRRLTMRWGPVGLETSGTVALDGSMRPLGAFAAKIIGYGDVIDVLIANGLVPVGDAFIYKVAFNLLAQRPDPEGPPELDVPVTMQDGELVVGPVTLFRLPPLISLETASIARPGAPR